MRNRSYFYLIASLLMLLSLSTESSERLRNETISFFSPGWNKLHKMKVAVARFWQGIGHEGAEEYEEELQRLRLQNQLLSGENRKLKDLLQLDWDSQEEIVCAEVIFRSPSTWNSSLWINLGTAYNEKAGKTVVAKNSPVLYGRSLVGVIDYVGLKQSRVRLITDSGLAPSVRAMRLQGNRAYLLAKGELHGSSQPLWRKEPHLLKGIGFNYDFADAEGPPRDLRTGKAHDSTQQLPALPLIQVNDRLVTTGMDGVFPKGLEVAIVTKVSPLNEGDYYYEIEARPSAGELDRLSYLFLIPPLGYDPDDQPGY